LKQTMMREFPGKGVEASLMLIENARGYASVEFYHKIVKNSVSNGLMEMSLSSSSFLEEISGRLVGKKAKRTLLLVGLGVKIAN